MIFGLFRLLGYQYSPRLADAGGATFWRINPTDYGLLNGLARHQVNTRLVERHYDDLLRVAGSRLARIFVPLFPTARVSGDTAGATSGCRKGFVGSCSNPTLGPSNHGR